MATQSEIIKYGAIGISVVGFIGIIAYLGSRGGTSSGGGGDGGGGGCKNGSSYVRPPNTACIPDYVPSGNLCVCILK